MKWLLLLLVTSSCATVTVQPTSTHPLRMCSISCAGGGRMVYGLQHLCTSGVRQFEPIDHVIGEFIHRNEADGTVESAVWIACVEGWRPDGSCAATADYPKRNVEPHSCDQVLTEIRNARPAERRGQFPGEDEFGHPQH